MPLNPHIDHPGVRREIERFERLGGKVTAEGENIVLDPNGILPSNIAKAFVGRIRKAQDSACGRGECAKVTIKIKTE